jgi:hypothetical protein
MRPAGTTRLRVLALAGIALAGVPAAASDEYPALQPLDRLLAREGGTLVRIEDAQGLVGRATDLVARADSLRARVVVDAGTRARFAALEAAAAALRSRDTGE